MPPDQALLKGLSPRKGRETIQLIGYSLSLFNLYHFAEGCVPKVPRLKPIRVFRVFHGQTKQESKPLNTRNARNGYESPIRPLFRALVKLFHKITRFTSEIATLFRGTPVISNFPKGVSPRNYLARCGRRAELSRCPPTSLAALDC